MKTVYANIFPTVRHELAYWKRRADGIPNEELRDQALASISSKRFHCQGGGVYALLARENWKKAIRFIVAYQTISDYLDNLCDRSTSLDPDDFRLLHQSMIDALTPGNKKINYYQLRNDQDDGGYLIELVQTCQDALTNNNEYPVIQGLLIKYCGLYGDLQVHKHVNHHERVPRLTGWFEKYQKDYPDLNWYEFSAAAGSTLGIFCLVGYMLGGKMSAELASAIDYGYFPYMQGLHILLDYYIDQKEDQTEADLNFCTFYANQVEMLNRLQFFIEKTHCHVQQLPDQHFHGMVQSGLVGLYLGDRKVCELKNGIAARKLLLNTSGGQAKFFNWNTRLYYKVVTGK
ncbi:tetraprenyl-beta-curcumene synthase [Virgibacillus phasianinus]|uniref:Tetraprenyl-beta-curcumene synthase n=2 Tax=Virgibacillus phasianinus TaxID=2017483 RepID=A0A220U952_9BACI|nr:tetraprenyl-beta-curcumene synthase [Virgibacillus phasianinus]